MGSKDGSVHIQRGVSRGYRKESGGRIKNYFKVHTFLLTTFIPSGEAFITVGVVSCVTKTFCIGVLCPVGLLLFGVDIWSSNAGLLFRWELERIGDESLFRWTGRRRELFAFGVWFRLSCPFFWNPLLRGVLLVEKFCSGGAVLLWWSSPFLIGRMLRYKLDTGLLLLFTREMLRTEWMDSENYKYINILYPHTPTPNFE